MDANTIIALGLIYYNTHLANQYADEYFDEEEKEQNERMEYERLRRKYDTDRDSMANLKRKKLSEILK